MDTDTRHLRAFVAVVDEGTFTDAAIALRTSQASVSRSIQRLEAAVGQQLLARSTRSVQTTLAGERALVHARRLLSVLAELESGVRGGAESLELGYAWAALGRHTVAVQRGWADTQHGDLVLMNHTTPTAGLLEGRCEVSLVRRKVNDPRLSFAKIGTEARYAAVADDHALARRTDLALADFGGHVVAKDFATGTTSEDLWPDEPRPAEFRITHGTDEWLTLIASGRAVGVTSEATMAQHPRPGVTFRRLTDAEPIEVWLAWWTSAPPPGLQALIEVCREAYASGQGEAA